MTDELKQSAIRAMVAAVGRLGTQAEVARAAGVTPGMIWQCMKGRTWLKPSRAKALALAAGMHPHEFRPDVFDPPADAA